MSTGLDYGLWCLHQGAGELELEAMHSEVGAIAQPPVISLLLVAGELDELWVAEGVDSVARQSYPHWELCGAQFGSRSALDDAIAARMAGEARVRVCDSTGAANAQAALARALEAARGDYVLVLDEGDELPRDALLHVARSIHHTGADIVYSNEDRIDARGNRSEPIFKPGFSPDRLLCTPYVGRLCAFRSQLVEEAGGLQPALGRVAEHDLLLRATERASRVAHLPQILYHRRVLADSGRRVVRGVPDPPSADSTAAVVEAALGRRGEDAAARADREFGMARVIRRPRPDARVSLIMRSDRRMARLPLVHQLDRRSLVRPDEVIVAGRRPDREPGLPAVEDPFPARAANRAASTATGDVLIFCSHSASLPPTAGPRWLGELAAHAMRPEVGAVSGTVVDDEGRLRHGGLRVDLEGLAGPAPRELDLERLSADRPLNPGGAAADLVAIERGTFERLGGFDADHLPGSLFVLDLAFRLEEESLLSVYTPVAQVQCRGPRPFPSPDEVEYMWSRWRASLNRLLAYERSPLDPDRSPLAPERPTGATVRTRPIAVTA